jgi:hypothetical protein
MKIHCELFATSWKAMTRNDWTIWTHTKIFWVCSWPVGISCYWYRANIFNYLCSQSPLYVWVWIAIRTKCTTLCNKVYQWLPTGRWFSSETLTSHLKSLNAKLRRHMTWKSRPWLGQTQKRGRIKPHIQ